VDRRAFLGVAILGHPAALRVAEAQRSSGIPRVGYLSLLSRADPTIGPLRDALLKGLRELHYVDGKTITVEWRFAEGKQDRLPELAADLVRLSVDLIFAETTAAARAARQATTTIPIVFNPLADPVREGFVASLGRPGGNLTGLTQMAPELSGKRVEVFKEAVPEMARLGVLSHPGVLGEATGRIMLEEPDAGARASQLQLPRFEAQRPDGLDAVFGAMSRERVDGVVVLASPMFLSERRRIADLAIKNRLPTRFILREFGEAGGLMSYGPNYAELWRRSATYVHRILKGAKPADLPVEQPTKFELVINLRTAKALGLTIPPAVLARADQVVQ
jgi:putative ABC transport system substrate-binding protein